MFSLSFMVHAAAFTYVLLNLSQVDFQTPLHITQQLALLEYQLHIDGHYLTAEANLTDAAQLWTDVTADERDQALAAMTTELHQWQEQNITSLQEECLLTEQSNYEAQIFRFNEIDQPHRRLNWSFRLQKKDAL